MAAFEHFGQGRAVVVVEVVDGGGGVGLATGHSADALDDVALERDGGGEDEGVESGEVEAFAGDFVHGDEDEVCRGIELGVEGVELGGSEAAGEAEDVGVGKLVAEFLRERGDVGAAVGQDEDVVASLRYGGGDGKDLGVAGSIGSKGVVDLRHVDGAEDFVGELSEVWVVLAPGGALGRDSVPDGSEQHGDEGIEAIGAVGRGGKPSPIADVELAERGGEARRGYAVTFVDADLAILLKEGGVRVLAADSGGTDDVHDVRRLGFRAGRGVEEACEAIVPLSGEFSRPYDDSGGDAALSDERAGNDGFAGSGRGDKDADVVGRDVVEGLLLWRSELAGEGGVNLLRLGRVAAPGDGVACFFENVDGWLEEATVEAVFVLAVWAGVFLIADDDAGLAPRGKALILELVELGVGEDTQVAQGIERGGVEVGCGDVDEGVVGDGDLPVLVAFGFVGFGDFLQLLLAEWGGKFLGIVVGVERVADLLELVLRGEAGAGKSGELVVEGPESVVDEDGRAVLTVNALQREGNEVAQLGLAARVDG